MNRHPFGVSAILLCVVSLAAGTAVYFAVGPTRTTSNNDQPALAAEDKASEAPVANALGPADRARLPADRVLLPSADAAECRGLVVSGHSMWGIPELREKSVLWDERQRHLVVVLPNEKLGELQEKLTPK